MKRLLLVLLMLAGATTALVGAPSAGADVTTSARATSTTETLAVR
jgi:hypothetical protein